MPMIQTLEEILDFLESRGAGLRLYLRPGLSREDVKAALEPLGLEAPEELYELYGWHDGVEDWRSYKVEFLFGEHQFLPLKIAVQEHYETLKYYNEYTSLDLNKWLPFGFFEGSSFTLYCEDIPFEGLIHL